MPAYAALLRGVSPMSLKMPDLKECLESAGFHDVKTVLSSGNAVFTTRAAADATIERRAEAAMKKHLGQSFLTIVRSIDALAAILSADPYQAFRTPANAKRVVTFLKDKPRAKLDLPVEIHGARILCLEGREVFTAYVPNPRAAVFMSLIEKTLGKEVTTRTWDTVKKLVKAAG
jgi:uncharacterized protein (DUF1697 family)